MPTHRPEERRLRAFPTGIFKIVVALVCIGLATSAISNFVRLDRLRLELLRNQANEIASAINSQARGPNRWSADYWQGLLAENQTNRADAVAFLCLIDESGAVLATGGQADRFASVVYGKTGWVRDNGTSLYVSDVELPMPGMAGRAPGGGMGKGMGRGGGFAHANSPRRLRVVLYSSQADFIWWQALGQVAMNGVAFISLIALSYYFLHTLKRFLELKAKEESERHLATIGSMAATLAHEIRNPLGAMKGLTQLAQEDPSHDEKTQSMLSTVVHEAERLEQLVTDLLTFARPRNPQIGRFDFRKLMEDLRLSLQPRLDAARIRLSIESSAQTSPVYSDENGIRQVLLNVLLNAIDMTTGDGTIAVRLMTDHNSRFLTVEVDDSGPGLGSRDPEELFQPFTTTKVKGTGLWLPISRQIMERLGGRLELSNRAEGGARCTITVKT